MAKFNGFYGDYSGLTEEQIKTAREKDGANELAPQKKHTFIGMVLGVFKEPMFLLLIVTAVLYFVLGEPRDGTIMLCFVAFVSGISIFQEWRTDKTLQALRELSSPKVEVIRSGELRTVDSCEIVRGDLMVLHEGDRIAADGRILEMADLGTDESTLTGESEVVWKKINLSDEEKAQHWKRDFCYTGTSVTQGSAVVLVTATGQNTEYGKIGKELLLTPQQPTPLEKQTRSLIKSCFIIGIALFLLVALFTFLFPRDVTGFLDRIVHSVLAGMTLAMAMIPEEFPVILTVFLAMGAWRLARKNALIRRMPSVETLGAVTVLCVDKTGTLTENRMTVQETVATQGTESAELVRICALACEPEPFDPMEKAMLAYAGEQGVDTASLFGNKLLMEYPFSSEAKMMGHIWEISAMAMLAAKGSPESILPLCGLSKDETMLIQAQQNRLASQGFRVIAVAKGNGEAMHARLADNRLTLLGLIGLEDPPKAAVKDAVKLCRRAGIRIVMITGDNGTTALSIAKKIGIDESVEVLTGDELDRLSDEELHIKIKHVSVFARVIPGHKLRIVKALQDSGEVVAMTGDGVNDAPALKCADIGIAMGKRGTNVAKEASDMVLLDDNFTTIVDTVRDGRRIYDNIRKAFSYVLIIHIPIALIALISPLLPLPLLLLPIHIVLLELVIDPTCSIIFERQPAEREIMDRGPRSPKEPLVGKGLMLMSLIQGAALFAATFFSYLFLLGNGILTETTARGFALAVLIFSNLLLVAVNRSKRVDLRKSFFYAFDKVTLFVNFGILVMLTLILYTPIGNDIASTAPLGPVELLGAGVLACIATLWQIPVRAFKRKNKNNA